MIAAEAEKGQLCFAKVLLYPNGITRMTLVGIPWFSGGLNEPAAVAFQVMPMGTPGEPVAPVIGTGVKT